jgi:hypothetical protein
MPAGVAVSSDSDKLTNSIPSARNVSSARKRWETERAKRSNSTRLPHQSGACEHRTLAGPVRAVARCVIHSSESVDAVPALPFGTVECFICLLQQILDAKILRFVGGRNSDA